MKDETTGSSEFMDTDWENRVLCSDESCIGVIGPDGRCKECGKAHEGVLPAAATPIDGPAHAAESNGPADTEPQQPNPPVPAAEEDDDWENRTLCSDESCIGVIGPDGCCKECGKPYDG